MLTLLDQQTTSLEQTLANLLAQVEEHRAMLKAAKARQQRASRLLDNLKSLIAELPGEAIDQLKSSVLGLFPPETVQPLPSQGQEMLENFVTEVPKADIIDLSAYRDAWGQWRESIAPVKTTDNDYAQTEYLNDTVCYIKKFNGELLAGYIACAKRELATDWTECLSLWGCRAEARKAKRFGKGIKWEVKVTKISMEQLLTIANHHGSLYDSVPKPLEQLNMKNRSVNGNGETDATTTESVTENCSSDVTPPKIENSGTATTDEDDAIENKLLDQLGLSLQLDNSDWTCPEWIVWHQVHDTKKAIGRIRKHLTREQTPWLHSDMNQYELSRGIGYPDKYSAARALLAKIQAKERTHKDMNASVMAKYGL